MTDESQRLRDLIRADKLACHCREIRMRRGEPGPIFNDYHLPGCSWIAAVLRIYELERSDEERRASNSNAAR